MTATENGHVRIEVHDSGPGLSATGAQYSCSSPTHFVQAERMGLDFPSRTKARCFRAATFNGARRLGGAAFRVLLPRAKQEDMNPRRILILDDEQTSAARCG